MFGNGLLLIEFKQAATWMFGNVLLFIKIRKGIQTNRLHLVLDHAPRLLDQVLQLLKPAPLLLLQTSHLPSPSASCPISQPPGKRRKLNGGILPPQPACWSSQWGCWGHPESINQPLLKSLTHSKVCHGGPFQSFICIVCLNKEFNGLPALIHTFSTLLKSPFPSSIPFFRPFEIFLLQF